MSTESLGFDVVQSSVVGSTAMYLRLLWLVRFYAVESGFVELWLAATPILFCRCPRVLLHANEGT